MAVDFATFALLGQPLVRPIFETVVNERSIRFNDLLRRLSIPDENREDVKVILRKLKDANLIAEVGALLEDFSTFYVTYPGLELSRFLSGAISSGQIGPLS